MTADEILLLKASLQKMGPQLEQAAGTFAERLFQVNPGLGDIAARGRELLQMMGAAVQNIGRLERLAPSARQFGRRHASFHIRQRDYDVMGEAFLWSLGRGLGHDFTEEMETAWGKVYWLMAEIIRAGARDGAASLKRHDFTDAWAGRCKA
jgi:hemoglobin-like flavoprotein